MFTAQYREEVREKILGQAKQNSKIVAAAVIGSYASGKVDNWSDIDLTFGVDESVSINSILDSWSDYMWNEFGGIMLFDVTQSNTTYRVFILPGCLQVDLSFAYASHFGAFGTNFKLLYGKQYPKSNSGQLSLPKTTKELFGYMIHHILRARIAIERDKLPIAEFWISEAKKYALKLSHDSKSFSCFKGKEQTKEAILKETKLFIMRIPSISEEVSRYSFKLKDILSELSQ